METVGEVSAVVGVHTHGAPAGFSWHVHPTALVSDPVIGPVPVPLSHVNS